MLAKLRWVLLAGILSVAVTPAFAQGCAMCYQTVKGAPKEAQRTINRSILVMLVLPVGAMTVGVGCAFRYGKKRDQENDRAESEHLNDLTRT